MFSWNYTINIPRKTITSVWLYCLFSNIYRFVSVCLSRKNNWLASRRQFVNDYMPLIRFVSIWISLDENKYNSRMLYYFNHPLYNVIYR